MRSLASDRPAVTAACRDFLSAGAERVARLSRAPASGSYRVRLDDRRSVIVKLYFGAAGWKAAKERHIIDAVSDNGTIRTAKVLGCGQLDTHDASALVTTDLGDRNLWRAVEETECSYREALGLVGQLLARFHDIDLAITAVGDEAYQRPETVLERLTQRLLSLLRRASSDGLALRVEPALHRLVQLSGRPSAAVGCHGDLHPANVVMCWLDGGVLAAHLVDFEAAVRCLPEYDVAKSIVTSSALGSNERLALLAGYGDRRILSDELLYAFVVFHAVDGWVHAALLEERDRSLWRGRVDEVLAHYAPLF